MGGDNPDKKSSSEGGFIFDREILDAFVAETKDHLRNIENDLAALEKQSGQPNPQLIESILRAVHSLRGSSGFMELKKISGLASAMENLLQKMRSEDIAPQPRHTEALLAGCDLLKKMAEDIGESEKTDTRQVYDRLVSASGMPPDSAGIPASETRSPPSRNKEGTAPKPAVFDEEMVGMFIAETKEHLENIEDDFLILERQGREPDQKLIDKLFRAIHSVKGSAGMLSLGKISHLAHAMETLLQKMRSGEIYPESRYISALLAGCDCLSKMIASVKESEKVAIQELVDRLSELTGSGVRGAGCRVQDSDPAPSSQHPVPSPQSPAQPERIAADTVRIKVELLNQLMTLAGELVLVRNQQLSKITGADPEDRGIFQRMDRITSQMQEAVMRTRMQPVGNLFGRLPRMVRDLSQKLGKNIQIVTRGDEVELDKTILESLTDPMAHLIRNACDHGIEKPAERLSAGKPETGTVFVHAYHEAGQINIVIRDDGKGINPAAIREKALAKGLKTQGELNRMSEGEILSLIMLPGFSTSEFATEISGRGVGTDVVKSAVEQQGGHIDVTSAAGKGTSFHICLPLTLAIIPCLLLTVGNERFAVPKVNVAELVCLYDEDVFARIEYAGVQEVFRLRRTLLPLVRLHEVLARPRPFTEETRSEITGKYQRIAKAGLQNRIRSRDTLFFAVVRVGTRQFGLIADSITGSEEIVVNPVHPKLKSLGIYSGTAIMGDGTVAMILDVRGIAEHSGVEFISSGEKETGSAAPRCGEPASVRRVLIFKNGEQERFAVPLSMIRRVSAIRKQRIETVGSRSYITVDGIPTLILRLDCLLDVSPCILKDEMYLLLPRENCSPAFGILMSELCDVLSVPLTLNGEGEMEDGILGTALIQERLTLFPDIRRLAEKASEFRGEVLSDTSQPSAPTSQEKKDV